MELVGQVLRLKQHWSTEEAEAKISKSTKSLEKMKNVSFTLQKNIMGLLANSISIIY